MSLRSGLIAYWPLNEASGVGYSHNGLNDLTDNNTVTSSAGFLWGLSRQFTAANSEYLSLADNADLSTGDIDFSFTAWVYLDSKTATGELVAKRESVLVREYALEYDQSIDRFQFVIFDGGGTQIAATAANTFGSPSTGAWHFVVGWHDSVGDLVGISVNGGATDTAATGGTGPSNTTAIFTVGVAGSLGGFLDGRLSNIGFWKRVLTATERAALYNDSAGLAFPWDSPVVVPGAPWRAQRSRLHALA